MKISELGLVCVVCTATLIQAATFSTPIYSVARNSKYARAKREVVREERIAKSRTNSHRISEVQKDKIRASRRNRRDEVDQKRLKGPVGGVENDEEYLVPVGEGRFDDGRARYGSGVPEWDWNELVYVIDLRVGSPPQSSRVLLSISDNDMFIPSTDCTNTCSSDQLLYNYSSSNTHKMTNTLFAIDYARCAAFGNIASDTVTLAGLTISQQFGAVDSIGRFTDPDWGNLEWNGLLGLAPSSTHSPNSISNPFLNLHAQKLLSNPIFTLLLPQTPDTLGLLTFGEIDHTLYTGPLKPLPLLNISSTQTHPTTHADPITDRWQIPCKSLSISGTSSSYPLHSYVALLETSYPGIGLPSSLVASLHNYLSMEFFGYDIPPSIPCSRRDSLPVITLHLGGHEFPLSAYEYTFEVEREDMGGRRCVSLFMEREEEGEGEVKSIILGSGVLRNWFGVFNLGAGEVAFGKVAISGEGDRSE